MSANEFILVTVPRKQNRAGTAATIQFADAVLFVCGEIDFRPAGTPVGQRQPDHFRRYAQWPSPREDRRCVFGRG